MKIINNIANIIIIYLVLCSSLVLAKNDFFEQGKILFEKKEFEKSKIFFEKDLVYNPKSEKSYLFLAKIFKENEDDELTVINLNNVLILNPKNDEAIYLLTLIKIEQSNYNEAKELIKEFDLVCKKFCSKKREMQKKFNKLIGINE